MVATLTWPRSERGTYVAAGPSAEHTHRIAKHDHRWHVYRGGRRLTITGLVTLFDAREVADRDLATLTRRIGKRTA